jgi:hypothetical protein
VLGALPTRMACMSPVERATLLRACVDEIVVQSDGMLTITGVLPAAEAIQPSDSFPYTLTCLPTAAGREAGHRPSD